jgi:hypothetical protein
MEWPEELYFAAQINLADLRKVDRSERLQLLLQDELGDASIHFWIEPDHLAQQDFSECWVDGSGT